MPKQSTTKPKPASPAFMGNTFRDAGTRYQPFGQDIRDQSLLAFDATMSRIVRSYDDGLTYAPFAGYWFPSRVNEISYLPDGEVVVAVGETGTKGQSVWRSSGWANPATATFTETLFVAKTLNWGYGGWDVKGNTVFVSEYGDQGIPAASKGNEAARRAYLSRDGGKTFTQVFDLNTTTVDGEADPWGSPARQQHLHGCAYDQQWNRLWVVVGDATGGTGVCAVIYSDNDGATWQAYPNTVSTLGHWQSVLPDALEHAVVFASDFDANGMRRIGRSGYRQGTGYGAAHVFDHGTGIRVIGLNKYKAPGVKDAPNLYAFAGIGATYPGGVVGTLDGGRTFHTLYRDPLNTGSPMNYKGATKSIGPTNTGRYVTLFNDTARYANGAVMVSELVKPSESAGTIDFSPLISNEKFINAQQMYATKGAPTYGSATVMYGFPSWRLKKAELNAVGTMINPPAGWNTYDIEIVYSNTAANSGNVAWRLDRKQVTAVGSQYFPNAGTLAPTALSSGVGVTQALLMATGVSATAGKLENVLIQRSPVDPADTFPDDVFFHGLRLIRKS